jgi:hypothetical protein
MSKTSDNNLYKAINQPTIQNDNKQINTMCANNTCGNVKKFKETPQLNKIDQENDVFWLEDPTVYLKNKNYLKILPDHNMTKIQQLNSINLLALYALIILFILRLSNQITTVIFVGLIAITIILYFKKYNNPEPFTISDDKINIESGYYSSDDDLIMGKFRSYKNCNTDLKETTKNFKKPLNEIKHLRREPTIFNPYMNPILTDYNNYNNNDDNDSNSVKAINADDDSIHQEPSKTYDLDMFKDLSDIFDKKNAERQFYTVPGGTIPNDQQKFADWCYKTPITCKDDTTQCRVFEDIRYRSGYRN